MSRPKGSKNKKVEEVIVKTKKVKPIGHGMVLEEGTPPKAQEWKPKPEIKEEKKSDNCSECGHQSEKHYGGDDRWCNHPGCACLEIK